MNEIENIKRRTIEQNLFWMEKKSGMIFVKFHNSKNC